MQIAERTMFSFFSGASDGIQMGTGSGAGGRPRREPVVRGSSEPAFEADSEEVGVDILEAMDILKLDAKQQGDLDDVLDIKELGQKASQDPWIVSSKAHVKSLFSKSRSLSASSSGVFSDKTEKCRGKTIKRTFLKKKKRTRGPLLGLPNVDWKNFARSAKCKRIGTEFAAALKKEAEDAKLSQGGGIKRFFPTGSPAQKNSNVLWSSTSKPLVIFHNSNGYTSDAVTVDVVVTQNSVVAVMSKEESGQKSRVLFDVRAREVDSVAFDLEAASVCIVRLVSTSNYESEEERRWFSLQLCSKDDLRGLLPALELASGKRRLLEHLPLRRLLVGDSDATFSLPREVSLSVPSIPEVTHSDLLFKESHLMFREGDDVLGASRDKWQTGKFVLKYGYFYFPLNEKKSRYSKFQVKHPIYENPF